MISERNTLNKGCLKIKLSGNFMTIIEVSKYPESIPTIANWIVDEWGHASPDLNFENLTKLLKKQKPKRKIPKTYVAVEKDRILGTASVVKYDLPDRLELTPWLAAVFVDNKYRNLKVGSELVSFVVNEAKKMKIKRFYLWTANKMDFYSKLGWKFYDVTEFLNKKITIMVYEF